SDTKSGLVTPVMMAVEHPWRSIAIYVFMASDQMLCKRSNAVQAIEFCAGDRMLCGRVNAPLCKVVVRKPSPYQCSLKFQYLTPWEFS
ncbi:MAG TPA: hypothetical protein VLA84_12970, partial [Microcoleus sp.]|nr:hypothetical protein [Microcoleus sp.]